MRKRIDELVRPEQLQSWLAAAFSKVGITTLAMLNDDAKVEKVAHFAYESMPFPVRVAVRATVGESGFAGFVFRVRDKMLEAKTSDLSRLTLDNLESLWEREGEEKNQHLPQASRAADEHAGAVELEDAAELEPPRVVAETRLPQELNGGEPKTASSDAVRGAAVQESAIVPATTGRQPSRFVPCPSCRYMNRPQARFCRACGTNLGDPSSPQQPASVPDSTELQDPDATILAAPLVPPVAISRADAARDDKVSPSGATEQYDVPKATGNASRQAPAATPTQETRSGPERTPRAVTATTGIHGGTDRKPPPETWVTQTVPEEVWLVTDQPSPVAEQPSRGGSKHIGYWIAASLAGMMLSAAAVYFAMGGSWSRSTSPVASAPARPEVPPAVVTPPSTAGAESKSDQPESGQAPEGQPPATGYSPVAPDGSTQPGAGYSPNAPDVPSPTAALKSGKAVYASSCGSCHATGVSGAPRLDDAEAWKPILARNRTVLYESVRRGKGAMPPRGGDPSLRDEEVKRAVDFMVASAKSALQPSVPKAPTGAPSTPPSQVAPPHPASGPEPPTEGQGDWLRALRSELQQCSERNFLERVLCAESARWKYCAPNRWNTVPECAVQENKSNR